MSEKKKHRSMGRNIYLLIITCVTAACVIIGLAIHAGGLFETGSHIEEMVYESGGEDIKSLEIDSGVMDVNVKPGEKFTVFYSGKDRFKPDVTLVDGRLKIKKDGNVTLNISVQQATLEVTVPEGKAFDNIYLNSGVGNMDIYGVNTAQTDIDSGVGKISISESELGNLKVNGGVGSLKAEKCSVKDVDVDSGVGKVELNLTNSLKNYYMELHTGVGKIVYNGTSVDESYVQNGDGGRCVVNGGVGDVMITDGGD